MYNCSGEFEYEYFNDIQIIVNENYQFTISPLAYLEKVNEFECFVAIMGMPAALNGQSQYLLGDTLLKTLYVSFDYEL